MNPVQIGKVNKEKGTKKEIIIKTKDIFRKLLNKVNFN